MYHSRVSSTSCSLANSASISASGMQWNARSQAAYHGYSHLSGIEMMSALLRCAQSRLRPCLRSAGGGGCVGSPFSHSRHVVVVELLAPDHAGERLALDAGARRRRACRAGRRRRTRRPRARALRTICVEVGERLGVSVPRAAAGGPARCRRAGIVEPIVRRRLRAVAAPDSPRRVAADDVLVERVLEVARASVDAEQPRGVGLVLAEQQLGVAVGVQSDSSPQLACLTAIVSRRCSVQVAASRRRRATTRCCGTRAAAARAASPPRARGCAP